VRTTALELSGGKDSVACLYLLRDKLENITVYWLNTGDPYPETVAVIEKCKKIIPHFVEVKSDVIAWRSKHGVPSDVVPVTGTHVALPIPDGEMKVVDSYTCCAHNIMLPLHRRVVEDGNTTIIRGQRNAEFHKSPIRNGQRFDGIDFMFPIEDWSDEEVMSYLKEVGAPIHPAYTTGQHGADCLHCTGWWEHHNHELLAQHPKADVYVSEVRGVIKRMIDVRMAALC
jgi:3'-phosphoadenosine 5'-phosphosulfate sulfotransferase (PAPS reductase)/FAD synthetase